MKIHHRMCLSAVLVLGTVSGCIVLPFGHDGGGGGSEHGDRGEHGDRRSRELHYTVPQSRPFRDAGDDSEQQRISMATGRYSLGQWRSA